MRGISKGVFADFYYSAYILSPHHYTGFSLELHLFHESK